MKRVLIPGLFGVAIYFAVFGGEYSVLEMREARVEQARESVQLEVLRALNDSLSARADSVESHPATIERLARERFGMIKPGEVLYRFAGDDDDPDGEVPPVVSPDKQKGR